MKKFEKYSSTYLINEVIKGNFLIFIIYFIQSNEIIQDLLNYIRTSEKKYIILDSNKIDYNFCIFYCLGVLIEANNEINFIYNYDLINRVYETLIKNEDNNDKIIRMILSLKITYDLINNYEKAVEKSLIKENIINTIKNEINFKKEYIKNKYGEILDNNQKVIEELNITKTFDELNIKAIFSKAIINLYKNPKFDNSNYLKRVDFLNSLDIRSIYVDKDTISEIKSIIDSEENNKKYLLSKEDFPNLKKINYLHLLLTYILNTPSDLKNFSFLFKTKLFLNEISNNYELNYLINNNVSDGLKLKYLKIVSILNDNSLSISGASTDINSKNQKNCSNSDFDRQKYYFFKVHFPENISEYYDLKAIKLFNQIVDSILKSKDDSLDLFDRYNCIDTDRIKKYLDELEIIKEFNDMKKSEDIFFFMKTFYEMQNEFKDAIDLEIIIKKIDEEINIILRSCHEVYLYIFKMDDPVEFKKIVKQCSNAKFVVVI